MITKKCASCKTIKPVSEFHKNKSKPDGLQTSCKPCRKERNAALYQKYRPRIVSTRREKRHELSKRWRRWKGERGCSYCEENESICLELHHLNPSEKELHPAEMIQRCWSWKRIMKEAAKCIIVCSNCHKKIHAGLIKI